MHRHATAPRVRVAHPRAIHSRAHAPAFSAGSGQVAAAGCAALRRRVTITAATLALTAAGAARGQPAAAVTIGVAARAAAALAHAVAARTLRRAAIRLPGCLVCVFTNI